MELVKKGKKDKIKEEMKEVRIHPLRPFSPEEQKIKQRTSVKSVKKKKKETVVPAKKAVSPTNQHVYWFLRLNYLKDLKFKVNSL